MKLAFWLPRLDHLRVLGPVADAARKRGHELLWVTPAFGGTKDTAYRHFVAALGDGWAAPESILGAVRATRDLDAVVAVGLMAPAELRDGSGVPWAALPYRQEEILAVLERGPVDLEGWRLVTTASEAGRDCLPEPLRWRLAVIGDPILDPVPTLDREQIRAEMNLPAGQKVVFFATAARPARLPRLWRWSFFNEGPGRILTPRSRQVPEYQRTVIQIKRWADRHDALLLASSRPKHLDPAWLDRYTIRRDRDENDQRRYHPFRTLELLMAADAYVGFASTLAVEATACGLQQHHLLAWPTELVERDAYLPLRRRFYEAENGLWNGVLGTSFHLYEDRGWERFQAWAERGIRFPARVAIDGGLVASVLEPVAGPFGGASDRFLDLVEGL